MTQRNDDSDCESSAPIDSLGPVGREIWTALEAVTGFDMARRVYLWIGLGLRDLPTLGMVARVESSTRQRIQADVSETQRQLETSRPGMPRLRRALVGLVQRDDINASGESESSPRGLLWAAEFFELSGADRRTGRTNGGEDE